LGNIDGRYQSVLDVDGREKKRVFKELIYDNVDRIQFRIGSSIAVTLRHAGAKAESNI
jgi:hypothetical protein